MHCSVATRASLHPSAAVLRCLLCTSHMIQFSFGARPVFSFNWPGCDPSHLSPLFFVLQPTPCAWLLRASFVLVRPSCSILPCSCRLRCNMCGPQCVHQYEVQRAARPTKGGKGEARSVINTEEQGKYGYRGQGASNVATGVQHKAAARMRHARASKPPSGLLSLRRHVSCHPCRQLHYR
jgi:hypothetical protein